MIKLEIDETEKRLLLLAITAEQFTGFIQMPSTPYQVRQAYKSIKTKLKESKNTLLIVP